MVERERETLTLRLSDGVAFVLGASVWIVTAIFAAGWTRLPSMILGFLCPGFHLGIALVGLLLPPWLFPDIGWILPIAAVVNGLFYGLAWYLARIAMKGQRAALLAVVLGVGLWTAWYVRLCMENMPRPEPPPMPVDLASPLAGRWEGVIHSQRGDRPVILICHPRTDGRLDGFLCVNGVELGPFDEGTFAGDSLSFVMGAFEYLGHRDNVQLTIESTVSGTSQLMELQFVSADTARLALPPMDP